MVKRAGVIGWPIQHSLSPALHRYWLRQYGIEGIYEAIEINPRDIKDIWSIINPQECCGFNVTIPHKETIVAQLDRIDEASRSIGAVNTVTYKEGMWQGTNTDVYGFSQHLISSVSNLKKKRALVLGAGGAARAVIYALKKLGFAHITCSNRSEEKAQKLAHDFHIHHAAWSNKDELATTSDLIVNATSLGMKGKEHLELNLNEASPHTVVYDIVYNPGETALLANARKHGMRTVDGLGMLIHQAVPAFAAWFGVTPEPDEKLEKHLRQHL